MGRMRIEGTAQMFNAFNVSNLVGPAGLPSSPYSGTLPTLATLPAGFTLASSGSVRDASGNQAVAGTTRLPNGKYRLRIRAWDVPGNMSKAETEVTIDN